MNERRKKNDTYKLKKDVNKTKYNDRALGILCCLAIFLFIGVFWFGEDENSSKDNRTTQENGVNDLTYNENIDNDINQDEKVEVGKEKAEKVDDESSNKKVYLTFDDGPSDNTAVILDILKEYDVKASFFVVGRTDEKSKKMYKRIYDEGHTLAMHTYSHDYKKVYASQDSFINDVEMIRSLLFEVTGERPMYYRFPGGSANEVSKVDIKKCIKYLNEQEIKYYDWNVLNGDAEGKNYSKEQLVDNIINDVIRKRTSIVLMHDTNKKEATVSSLPDLIKKLQELNADMIAIDDETPLIQQVKASSVK